MSPWKTQIHRRQKDKVNPIPTLSLELSATARLKNNSIFEKNSPMEINNIKEIISGDVNARIGKIQKL